MMAIIDNHIFDIVNNQDNINAFCENYLENDEDFNQYLEEIKDDGPLYFDGYHYDYDLYKYEFMNEIFGDIMKEQYFNNKLSILLEDITDADKHIAFKYLIGKLRQTDCCRTTINNLHDDYLEDNWFHIMMSYVYEKVQSMVFNKDDWLADSVISKIEDWVRNKLQKDKEPTSVVDL